MAASTASSIGNLSYASPPLRTEHVQHDALDDDKSRRRRLLRQNLTLASNCRGQNCPSPYTSDQACQTVLAAYLHAEVLEAVTLKLQQFGDEAVSDEVHELIGNAECQQPYVKKRDVWNNLYPYDRLITSQGWKELGKWGLKNGSVILNVAAISRN